MAISRQEWADWLRMDATQALIVKLSEKRDQMIESLINADGTSIEEVALHHVRWRNQLDGLGEFFMQLDGDWIVEEETEQ